MRNFFRSIFLASAFLAIVSCSQKDKVALLSCGSDAETDSLAALVGRCGYDCSVIDFGDAFDGYDLIWYHRSDTSALTPVELEASGKVEAYLERGGQMILSMDAVRLPYGWGLEENPVEISSADAVDYGFGRKLGFHAFRSHPVFEGLFGGAYVWHGYEDNTNRVLGYFGDSMPGRPGSRIVATQWEYIYYQPKDKVIWETPVGKGRIMSVGAFLYYSRPNIHKEILDRFTSNLLGYMCGRRSGEKARYWTYEEAGVEFDHELGNIRHFPRVKRPGGWNIAEDADALRFTAGREELTLPSRRAFLVAEERGGIKEIWTHPFMSLKDYRLTAHSAGVATVLDTPDGEVEFRYNSIIRKYSLGDDIRLTEILTVDPLKPVSVAHYEWEGPVDSLCVSFSSNMRYMWPYDEDALGTLHCGWSGDGNVFMVRDAGDEFISLVGTDVPAEFRSSERHGDYVQVDASFSIPAGELNACNVMMVAGNEGLDNALKDYSAALGNSEDVFRRSAACWQDYLRNTVAIETPDGQFNLGYRWATVSAGQFLAETPGLGSGLMAGYSSSLRGWGGGHRVSGRPGYAWYFGRDSELAALAFLSMGDFEAVKQTIRLLADYQSANGQIFHELTTSGSDHFDASDATPLFVVLVYEYLKATGDSEFTRGLLPNVRKAMDFCFSTDTDNDHLIEIEHVGHGWLEGGDYFAGKTEFYLSAIWLRALRDAAFMYEFFGDTVTAEEYRNESKTVALALENFWNAEGGYYNYGINYDGTYTTSHLALASVPVWLGVTDAERARVHTMKYAADGFSTDWGVRQTADPRPEEHVGAYDESNIWPLFTGSVSLAEYFTGRYTQGFDHMMASLLCYRSATHGRVPEVLRGNAYRSGGITRHQCWSETAVTGPAIQGMTGFSADALEGKCTLAPRIPFDWRNCEVRNLRCGGTRLSMKLEKSADESLYTLGSDGKLSVEFIPAFPPATSVEAVLLDGRELEFSVEELPEYTLLHTSFELDGDAVLTVRMKEGLSVLPSYREADDRGPSLGIRILEQKSTKEGLEVRVQGKAHTEPVLNIYRKGRKESISVPFGEETEKIIIIED